MSSPSTASAASGAHSRPASSASPRLNTGFNGVGEQVDGLTNGGGFDQLWRQALGVAAVAPYSFIVTFAILKILDLTVGIRVNEEDEVVRPRRLRARRARVRLRRHRPGPRHSGGDPDGHAGACAATRRQQRPRFSHDRARSPIARGS